MQRVKDTLDKLMEEPGEWTTADIPDLAEKTAIVTGANGGIGKQLVLDLLRHHCKVILVCRDLEKSEKLSRELLEMFPEAKLHPEFADFSDLNSVLQFTERLQLSNTQVSLLFNNAGVLDLPISISEKDGLDAAFKTNYLSHFLLTCNIMPLFTEHARIIFTGSTHHQYAKINFDDVQTVESRQDRTAYNNAKWMLMSFCMELQRRLQVDHSSIMCVAAHPGFTATNILTSTTGKDTGFFKQTAYRAINSLMGQKPEKGVLPLLYAATGLNVKGGDYYGPDGMMQYSGKTHKAECVASVYDRGEAKKLWAVSETLLQLGLAAHNGNKFTVPEMLAMNDEPKVMQPH